MSIKKEWCQQKNKRLREQSGAVGPLEPRVLRCPNCKKRFSTFITNCVGDLDFKQACCWWEYFPAHKKRKKQKEK